MLTMHEARARLAQFANADWPQSVKSRLEGVGGTAAEASRQLRDWLGRPDLDDTPLRDHRIAAEHPIGLSHVLDDQDWSGLPQHLMRQGAELDVVLEDVAARRELFAALLPHLAPHAERAWTMVSALPAHHAENAPPFRTPRSPDPTRTLRRHWLYVLLPLAGQYDQPVTWFAEWAAWIYPDQRYAFYLGVLLGAAIDGGGAEGEAVYRTLCESAEGTHPIGAMGEHIIQAFLACSRPEAWEYVGNLLRNAGREEGVRRVVMRTAGYSQAGAIRHLLGLVAGHGLLRHDIVRETVASWLGLTPDFKDQARADEWLAWLTGLLDDPEARRAAIAAGTPIQAYWALWATAVIDAGDAIQQAAALLSDPAPARRMAGLFLLAQTRLHEAVPFMIPVLDDADMRLATLASRAISTRGGLPAAWCRDIYAGLKRLAQRLPQSDKTRMPASPGEPNWLLWQGPQTLPSRNDAMLLLCRYAGPEHFAELREMIGEMDDNVRYSLADMLKDEAAASAEARAILVLLLADASSYVRQEAMNGLDKAAPADLDAPALEELLTRKGADLRRGALNLLLKLDDTAALASAGRLLAGKAAQRLGGLELLVSLIENRRAATEARALAQAWREKTKKISGDEEEKLALLLGTPEKPAPQDPPTLANAFGFYNPEDCTRPVPPRRLEGFPDFTVARRCLADLAAFIEHHQGMPYSFQHFDDKVSAELGLESRFPDPGWSKDYLNYCGNEPPLWELWQAWDAGRPDALRDPDGLELLRAHLLLSWENKEETFDSRAHAWVRKLSDRLFGAEGAPSPRSPNLRCILAWLLRLRPLANAPDYLLDLYETALANVPREIIDRTQPPHLKTKAFAYNICYWPEADPIKMIEDAIAFQRRHAPQNWHPAHRARLWRLGNWISHPVAGEPAGTDWQSRPWHFEWRHDESTPPVPKYRFPSLRLLIQVFEEGGANEADVAAYLVNTTGYSHIDALTDPKYGIGSLEPYPRFKALWARLQSHLIDYELSQRQQATPAAHGILQLHRLEGREIMLRALVAGGDSGLIRSKYLSDDKKSEVLSHLVQISRPTPEDTPERLVATMRELKIPAQRMIDLAVYAPLWAHLVEQAITLPGLAEAVFWIYAHARGALSWKHDEEQGWLKTMFAQFTALTEEDREEGAVDAAWFRQIYARLGAEGWTRLDKAAKHAAEGGGQKRAQLYAATMLGRADRAGLLSKVTEKRDKDAARALGLLPLAEGEEREADLAGRYEVLQEILRTSRQFGAQRRESEKRAVEMGIDNLAATAGYRDAQQLRWAMEARAAADLNAGAIHAACGDVTVTLAIDAQGQPEITAARNGQPLKAIPATVKKDAAVKELIERQGALKKQAARMRQSLEAAMVRGDVFGGRDLRGLYAHPLLRPLLGRLVFIAEGNPGSTTPLMGYPVEEGRALADVSGAATPVSDACALRIAHPLDLLESGRWPEWQRKCLAHERIQPFKQVFRELYVPTEAELKEAKLLDEEGSRRYAGQRLVPRQALGLLGGRGWVHEHLFEEEASLRRTFHEAGLAARLIFQESFHSPGEVEYATVDRVAFTDKGGWYTMPAGRVPPRLFSEVMRDLDLAVSVAAHGGATPEASLSTIEMRAALVGETAAVLGLSGVHIDGHHAIVAGKLASYSVHLGSAVVHVLTGGSLVLLPYEPAYAGKLFLPFADEDPRTAEVLSKVLLLAQDDKIKDPAILGQIRRLAP